MVAMMSSLFIAPAGAHPPVSAETVKKMVHTKFASTPVLIKIARCESGISQYKPDGSLLYNEKGSSAVGIMQIMSSVHQRAAQKLGYDITTPEGNIGYAKHLYKTQGTTPWNASKKCWDEDSA